MARPGFVLEVDERTPPLLVHEGEGFRLQKFPLGTRVIYPPDSLPGIKDAIDDISIPLPPMQTPDIRGRIIEQVLEIAARRGVDDVKLVVANSLHRRMTPSEIKRAVG